MQKHFDEKDKAFADRLTDGIIAQADVIVNASMGDMKEDMERYVRIPNQEYFPCWFSIQCRTSSEYRSYNFKLTDGGELREIGVEGDFRD